MTPFFFGESNHQLYGVLHPMQGGVKKQTAVVLCNAFGQEYMRSHRAYRQLAMMLSKQGYYVLRFDYRGTGDSALSLDQVNANDWIDDIGIAIDELREVTNVKKVNVIGLRLGGLLAASACSKRTDINDLILWDGLFSGVEYINELQSEMEIEGSENINGELNSNYQDRSGAIHFNGFSLSGDIQRSIKPFDLSEMNLLKVENILNVISHQTEESNQFINNMRNKENFENELIDAPHDWNYVDKYGGILLPQPIIQAIVNRLS
jgi:pimeloyl-ACP methyl ester carboxylesterase